MSDKREKRFSRGYAQGYVEGFRDGFRAGFREARAFALDMFGSGDDLGDRDEQEAVGAQALEDDEAPGVDEAFWAGDDDAEDGQDEQSGPDGTTGTEVGL